MILSRRAAILGTALTATGLAAFAARPRRRESVIGAHQLDALIPQRFGPWQPADNAALVLPTADEFAALIYDQQVARAYVDPASGREVMVLLAYSSSNDGVLQIHRPEGCYYGEGYTIGPLKPVSLPIAGTQPIDACYVTASLGPRREQILYWTRIMNAFPRDQRGQRIAVMRRNLAGELPDGALVRLSMLEPDAAVALPVLERFAETLLGAIGPLARTLLLGPVTGAAMSQTAA